MKCFDPKKQNGRCISYNRMADDYEKTLQKLKYKEKECEELQKTIQLQNQMQMKVVEEKNKEIENLCKNETSVKFDHREIEILQNECLKLFKRIEKLQYKHDYENLANYQLYDVNLKISALTKIKGVLEECL